MVDIVDLKLELTQDVIFIKGLSSELYDLKFELECCPEIDDLYNKLMRVKKLSGEMFDIIEDMQSIKHMAEI
jgi:hypothetical protein